jgi:peptidoglycan-associated lipoprotein
MRIWLALPLVALFGCAHEHASTAQASSNEYAAATQPTVEKNVQEKAQPPQGQASAKVCPLQRVHFEFDSAELSQIDKAKLDQAAICLKDNTRQQVKIEGNADERGTQEYNYELGQRRADAVSVYLESQGVSGEQLKTISFGKDRPRCTGHDEACWMHNRVAAVAPACRL